jgi:hypothetical protein
LIVTLRSHDVLASDGKVHQAYIARVKRSVSLVVLGTTEKENGSEFFVALLDPATGEPTSEDGPYRVALPASAKLGKLSGTERIAPSILSGL